IPFPMGREGNKNVSCDIDKRGEIKFPDRQVKAHLPYGNDVLDNSNIKELFEKHSRYNRTPVVLLFRGPMYRADEDEFRFITNSFLATKYPNSVVSVTNVYEHGGADGNSNAVTVIED